MNYAKIHDRLIERARSRTRGPNLQRHHIIPLHAGGTDEPSNLVYLTYQEHMIVHHLRWKIHQDKDDLLAYRLMRGIKNDETHRIAASLGGKKTGAMNAKSGHMVKIQTFESQSKGGKLGTSTLRNNNAGSFFNVEKHRAAAAAGGAKQGKVNALNGHLSRISALSKRNTGMYWITDGTKSTMIDKSQEIPLGWKKGRVIKCRMK